MKQSKWILGIIFPLVLTACSEDEDSTPTKGLNVIDQDGSDVIKAQQLEVDKSKSGRIGKDGYASYYFSANVDQTYYIELDNSGGDADLFIGNAETVDIGEHGPQTNLLAQSRLHGESDESIMFTAKATQDYFLIVKGYGLSSTSYTLSIDSVPNALKLDTGGSPTAGLIEFEEINTYPDERDDATDFEPNIHLATDLYVFDADPAISYRVRLIHLDETGDSLKTTDTFYGFVGLFVYESPALFERSVLVGDSQEKVVNDEVIIYGRDHENCPTYDDNIYCNEDKTSFYIDIRGASLAGYNVLVEPYVEEEVAEENTEEAAP